jgi:hypothetical protein
MPAIAAIHLRNTDSRARDVGICRPRDVVGIGVREHAENFMDVLSRHVGRAAYLLAMEQPLRECARVM